MRQSGLAPSGECCQIAAKSQQMLDYPSTRWFAAGSQSRILELACIDVNGCYKMARCSQRARGAPRARDREYAALRFENTKLDGGILVRLAEDRTSRPKKKRPAPPWRRCH